MTGYLLDTNVLSEILKKRPDPRVMEHLRSVPVSALATSVVCVTELRYGTARVRHGARLWARIVSEVLSQLDILPVGEREAVRAGDYLAVVESRGEPIGIEDVLIGASAIEDGRTIVTRNVRHFERLPGLSVLSWWD